MAFAEVGKTICVCVCVCVLGLTPPESGRSDLHVLLYLLHFLYLSRLAKDHFGGKGGAGQSI
jgi:hypothetical protein